MKTRNFVAANDVINNPDVARDKSFYKYNCICKKNTKNEETHFYSSFGCFCQPGTKT